MLIGYSLQFLKSNAAAAARASAAHIGFFLNCSPDLHYRFT